jgi:microsomal epoxide hydrolase
MNADQVAILWAKLMGDVLGYTHFYAAGGDMGTPITKSLANQYPEAVKAIHLTDVGYPNGSEDWSQMTQPEQEFGQLIQQWWFAEGAFNMIQSTKPQTLGYALNDSPVGLASWILEKFYAWSDNKGNIETRFTKDELLTNIMIYWVSQTINSSIRMYLENARAVFMAEEGPLYNRHVSTPTGVALFPGEAQFPEEWAKRMVNLKSITIMEKGGHFSAMEEPELWADNLKTFFKGID